METNRRSTTRRPWWAWTLCAVALVAATASLLPARSVSGSEPLAGSTPNRFSAGAIRALVADRAALVEVLRQAGPSQGIELFEGEPGKTEISLRHEARFEVEKTHQADLHFFFDPIEYRLHEVRVGFSPERVPLSATIQAYGAEFRTVRQRLIGDLEMDDELAVEECDHPEGQSKSLVYDSLGMQIVLEVGNPEEVDLIVFYPPSEQRFPRCPATKRS